MLRLPNGYAISAIPQNCLGDAWIVVREMIDSAADQAWGYRAGDVLSKLLMGEATLWIIEKDLEVKAAIVTEFVQYPRSKALSIWMLGGAEFRYWRDCIASLESYAKANNCDFITGMGRPGLMKLIGDLGFKKMLVTGILPLDKRMH